MLSALDIVLYSSQAAKNRVHLIYSRAGLVEMIIFI
jgi:hypothetical protein